MVKKKKGEEHSVRYSEELLNDPEWMAEHEKRRKLAETEDIAKNKASIEDKRKYAIAEVMKRKERERREKQHKKEIEDKMWNTPFTKTFIRERLQITDEDEKQEEKSNE